MSRPAVGAFWDWSVARYRRDGVEPALLSLQDEHGFDVNVLLWCAWCAGRFEEIPELALRKGADLLALYGRDVIAPLRCARRALKAPPRQADADAAAALRARVKDAELGAERIAQDMLETLAAETLTPLAAADEISAAPRARRNLARYISIVGAARRPGFSTLPFDALAEALAGGAPACPSVKGDAQ